MMKSSRRGALGHACIIFVALMFYTGACFARLQRREKKTTKTTLQMQSASSASDPCASHPQDLIEPKVDDKDSLDPFPPVIYGNMKYADSLNQVFTSRSHILRAGMKVQKRKPGKSSFQKRFVYVEVETSDDSTHKKLFLVYKSRDKQIPLERITSVNVEDDHFSVQASEIGRKRKGDSDGALTEFYFKYVDPTVGKEFAMELSDTVATYKEYMNAKDVEDHSADMCDSVENEEKMRKWAHAAVGVSTFYIVSPKSLSSVGIDYERMGTRSKLDGQKFDTAKAFVDAVFRASEESADMSSSSETLGNLLDKKMQQCSSSNAFAVLRAGVQNLVIQLEKRLMNLAFNSRKPAGKMVNSPLAGYGDASIGGQSISGMYLKTKNVYGDTPVDIQMQNKPATGAKVGVTRVMGVQTQEGAFVLKVPYSVSVDVEFTSGGPRYSAVNIDLDTDAAEYFRDAPTKLDDSTIGALETRLGRIKAAFSG